MWLGGEGCSLYSWLLKELSSWFSLSFVLPFGKSSSARALRPLQETLVLPVVLRNLELALAVDICLICPSLSPPVWVQWAVELLGPGDSNPQYFPNFICSPVSEGKQLNNKVRGLFCRV